jgi:hypothetical protein
MELTITFDETEIAELCLAQAKKKTYDLGQGYFNVSFNNRAYSPKFTCTWIPLGEAEEPAAEEPAAEVKPENATTETTVL